MVRLDDRSEIDLLAHLKRIAAVDEDSGAVFEDDRKAGRAGRSVSQSRRRAEAGMYSPWCSSASGTGSP